MTERTMPADPPWSESVFVVAEAGSNWRVGSASRDRAMARVLIDIAVDAGADAVKFQTYRPDTVYVPNAGPSEYLSKTGIDQDIVEMFGDLAMPYEMVPYLAEYCRAQGVHFMSTPFSADDFRAVDPHVSVHKIASYEIAHPDLIELCARSRKPLILSTGAATVDDIDWAVETFRAFGGGPIVLLQCTAQYPAQLSAIDVRVVSWLSERYGLPSGLSDHSRDPLVAPLTAVALGARVIEKHFTLDNRLPGPDHAFALAPGELRTMVRGIRAAEQVLGSEIKRVRVEEEELRAYAQRAIQATQDIAAGEALQRDVNMSVLRPGQQRKGAHPRHLLSLEGRPAKRDIPVGDGIQLDDVL